VVKTHDLHKLINKDVNIKPLDLPGRIKEIVISRWGEMYLIRYLYEMSMKEAYFYLDELKIEE